MVSDCVFCDIVAGRAPASLVYEDEVALAILDIRPVNPGHLLVIPRRHSAYLAEMDEATGMHLFMIAMRLAQALRRSGLRCAGINLFLADGEVAFQEILHVHLHVVPRFTGDAFRIAADWSAQPTRAELEANAARIRGAYASLWGDADEAKLDTQVC